MYSTAFLLLPSSPPISPSPETMKASYWQKTINRLPSPSLRVSHQKPSKRPVRPKCFTTYLPAARFSITHQLLINTAPPATHVQGGEEGRDMTLLSGCDEPGTESGPITKGKGRHFQFHVMDEKPEFILTKGKEAHVSTLIFPQRKSFPFPSMSPP